MVKLTFICSFNDDYKAFVKFLEHLKKQTSKKFQIYLISGHSWKKSEILQHYCTWKADSFWKTRLHLMVNTQHLGLTYNYNVLLHKLAHTYFLFVNPHSRLDYDFVKTCADAVQFCHDKTGHWPDLITTKPANRLYESFWTSQENFQIIAQEADFDLTRILPLFENNIYASRFAQKHAKEFYFRHFRESYLLFLYKYAMHASYIVAIDETVHHSQELFEINLLDIYKQWQHIFNYARFHNYYEKHLQQLNYLCVVSYLLMYYDQIIPANNQVIAAKIRRLIARKLQRIHKHFATNSYFQKTTIFDFVALFADPEKYLTTTKYEQLFK